MKFTALLAAFFVGTAVAQTGYSFGSTSTVTLPGTPTGTTDSTGGQVGLPNVVVPTFPKADILKLNGGSTSSQVTSANIGGTINGAKK